jgi:uncharacterized membrane protein YtjA (UPF0391 family)
MRKAALLRGMVLAWRRRRSAHGCVIAESITFLEVTMLSWSLMFLLFALIAAFFGFAGLAGLAASIAKILFVIFLVLFIVSLFTGRRVPAP